MISMQNASTITNTNIDNKYKEKEIFLTERLNELRKNLNKAINDRDWEKAKEIDEFIFQILFYKKLQD